MITPVRGADTTFGACAASDLIASGAGVIADAGTGAATASVGGGGGVGPLSVGAARHPSGVHQTNPSSVPDGETGAQRSLMTPSAPRALSRGARAARPSHSRPPPSLPSPS